jgi:F-type H+-transporting ATPase subunit gamma
MPSMRDIKRRIKSVKSSQQITKAMKMVAAAKLRKAQESVLAARPFASKTREVLGRVVSTTANVNHPLMAVREVKSVCYLLVTADRGLCGGYNSNIIRKAAREIRDFNNLSMIAVGRKGRDFFRKIGVNIVKDFIGLGESIRFVDAKIIADTVIEEYSNGVYDEVYLVYTEFVSALTQKPTTIRLLPLEAPVDASKAGGANYIFEPEAEGILDTLLPRYVETMIYSALLESKASEQGARMTAMSSATDNAKEIIDKLTLSYNRARQAAITREISEIVGGAAALD